MTTSSIVLAAITLLGTACVDDHQIGTTPSALAPTRWAISLGGAGFDTCVSVAIDPSGDIIAAGAIDRDVWIGKRSRATGEELWTATVHPLTPPAQVVLERIAVDHAGNVIAVGTYYGKVDFGGAILSVASTTDGFVAKYTASGELAWVRGYGVDSRAVPGAVAITADDRIHTSGEFDGVIPMPLGLLLADGRSGMLVTFSPTGDIERGDVLPMPLDLSASSNTLLASASIGRTFTFGGTSLAPLSSNTPIAIRFAPDGVLDWAHSFGDDGVEEHNAAVAISDGSILLATNLEEANRFPARTSVRLLDATGVERWVARSTRGSAMIEGGALLPDGGVITVGQMRDITVDLGSGSVRGATFLQTHDADGALLDVRTFGDRERGAESHLSAVATGHDGAVVIGGRIDQSLDAGTGPVEFRGGADALVVFIDE